ncbi:MAG TPA: TIR-like protein FxsC [Actinocrinis sp.]|nr:TIR-like protein FxsC [Actinocrinis sp.]
MSDSHDWNAAQPFFFLSYAHSAPLEVEPDTPDYWVQMVFYDLSKAVRDTARLERDEQVGFFDGLLEPGADWDELATAALNTAHVFVPLYSQRYFSMSWPGREWANFTERLARVTQEPRDEPSRHIVPILWAPLTRTTALPRNAPDPLAVVDDVPEYSKNGLRALKMLSPYGAQYERVIDRLSRKIVEVAGRQPLPPYAVSPLDQNSSAFRFKGAEDDFAVVIAAPTRDTLPDGRSAEPWYSRKNTDWRPFGDEERRRIGDHAISAAERLNFRTAVFGVERAAEEIASKPALMLIDPWITVPVDGHENPALRHLRGLFAGGCAPKWVLPILILNEADPESRSRKAELIDRVRRILGKVDAPPAETAQRDSDLITSMGEFARLTPALVAEAQRRYLRDYPSSEDRPDYDGIAAPDEDEEAWEQSDG